MTNRDDHTPPPAATPHPVFRMSTVGDDDAPCISDVLGAGADAHRIVRVRGWTLRAEGADGTEPMVRDIDAATHLGFARPRDVRKLIERIWPEGQRPHVRATVARTSMPRGGEREVVTNEYWLTERQLLKVIARAETDIAEAILDEMIDVFVAARRGLLPQQRPVNAAAVAELVREAVTEATAAIRDELASLRAVPLLRERVGREIAREALAKPIRSLAARTAAHDPFYSRRQHIGRLHIEMREAIGASPKLRLEDFDADTFRAARAWIVARDRDLERREDAARTKARRQARAAQGSLPLN